MGKACAKALRQESPLQRTNRAAHDLAEGQGERGENPANDGKSSEPKGDHWKILNLRVALPGAIWKMDQISATVTTGIPSQEAMRAVGRMTVGVSVSVTSNGKETPYSITTTAQ